jgi:hypothetical protein
LFELYLQIAKQHKNLPLKDERKLISLAKKGNILAKSKLLFSQTRFLLYRIKTMLYPEILNRYGEDIFQDCLIFSIKKISSYNIRYKNKAGKFQPVYFRTYLWKGITGVIINSIKSKNEIFFGDLDNIKPLSRLAQSKIF